MDEKLKTNVEGRFAEWAAKVIDSRTRYSVYPLVLRQSIRYNRRDEVKPGNLVEKGLTSLWKSWKNVVRKYALLYELWRMSKEKGPCSHSERPLGGKSPEECLSHIGRKNSEPSVTKIAAMRMRERSPMTRHDLYTFGMLLKHYLQTHVEMFDYAVKYRSSIASQHLEPSIQDGQRHPITFINFDVPEISSEKYRWESGWTETLLKTWEDTDANQLLVLAAFARSQFSSWPYVIVTDFSVGGEDEIVPPVEEITTPEGA
ncbi:hypothetical protein PM082_018490 [Marasmius tenuissimus]|nr:hypothetical protein PM082_018490 [Marasmius tenuissimus]